MKRSYSGCAICDSTWGDVWEEMEGDRVFFCCALCARQFRNLLERLHRETGWSSIDAIEIQGDRRGRQVIVEREGARRSFLVTFTTSGEVLRCTPAPALALDATPSSPTG